MHACRFDADVMGCVGPKSAAVAQSNQVVYNIRGAASVVASKKHTTTMQALYVVTMFQAPLVFIVASLGPTWASSARPHGVLPFGLQTVLLHTRSIFLSSRLDSFAG